jgi:VanZ family protein
VKKRWKLWLSLAATVLWLWFIYARSAKTAEASDTESGSILELLVRILPFLTMRAVRKLAHFTEYFILGGLLYADWRLLGRGGVLLPLGAGLVFAAADEILQTYVPGRSGQVSDVLLDLAGVAAAVGALLLLRRRREGKRHGS